jgi:hypothetical protein
MKCRENPPILIIPYNLVYVWTLRGYITMAGQNHYIYTANKYFEMWQNPNILERQKKKKQSKITPMNK